MKEKNIKNDAIIKFEGNENKYKEIGSLIKHRRNFLKMSQEDLVETIFLKNHREKEPISLSTIKRMEKGEIVNPVYYDYVFDALGLNNSETESKYPLIGNCYSKWLIYLPLIDLRALSHVLYRVGGNPYSDPYYTNKQLNYLFSSIPTSKAKEYADYIYNQCTEYDEDNIQDDYMLECYKEYIKQCNSLDKMFSLLSALKEQVNQE